MGLWTEVKARNKGRLDGDPSDALDGEVLECPVMFLGLSLPVRSMLAFAKHLENVANL
jgi:hypothetical protein